MSTRVSGTSVPALSTLIFWLFTLPLLALTDSMEDKGISTKLLVPSGSVCFSYANAPWKLFLRKEVGMVWGLTLCGWPGRGRLCGILTPHNPFHMNHFFKAGFPGWTWESRGGHGRIQPSMISALSCLL